MRLVGLRADGHHEAVDEDVLTAQARGFGRLYDAARYRKPRLGVLGDALFIQREAEHGAAVFLRDRQHRVERLLFPVDGVQQRFAVIDARRALERFYPSLKAVRLTDFKVNVLDSEKATGSTVRVVMESSDSESVWTTVGVSKDIIYASWYALVDSLEYKLLKDELKKTDNQ
ncbi:hypothetical protein SDC9_126614 [bioreactor metagenome]|uniref:2-isopropylmalate synthase LeuA allosteric (dimerisation) domain-containing protein n=1 Tax=bioreactor metagenome TaxID=1076179 RepID=A0A645CRQ0_9ZZZZ